jgi:hypothetical protein
MFRKLQLLLVLFTMAVFLLFTQGVSLYLHHCNISDKTYLGLYSPVSCQDTCGESSSCGHCCDDAEACKLPEPQHEEDDCCSDTHIYLKPEIQALPVLGFSSSQTTDYFILLHYPQENIFQINYVEEPDPSYEAKPPPKSGSFTVILFHSLKIPEFLS